jgi:hypothetical protein
MDVYPCKQGVHNGLHNMCFGFLLSSSFHFFTGGYHRTLIQFQPGREQQEVFHHTATEVCEDTRKLWYTKSRGDATRGWVCTSVINA